MKIVFVAPEGSYTEQLKKAFIKNRANVLYVSDREIKILPFLKKNVILWRIIRRLPMLRVINNKLFNRDLINLCRREKPELLFVNKGMIIYPRTLEEIKLMGIKTTNWFLDNIKISPYDKWFLNNAKIYDYFLSFDSSAESFREELNPRIYCVPMGIDPDFFKAEPVSEADIRRYSCSICFVGAFSPEREEMLGSVKNLGLKIFGWKGWENSSLAEFYGGPLNLEESKKLYGLAKICINMNTHPPVNGVNLKTFEIPAAGGFQLSDYRKDVDDLFIVGKEIDIFHNEDELREKVIFYIKNEQLRKNIAQAGRMRVLRDHTFEKRVADILRIVNYN